MTTQLLQNHPQILSYFAELHIGRPNKYHWPDLSPQDYKARFKHLIPRNVALKFLSLDSYDDFIFDFAFFRKVFLNLEKTNIDGQQRLTLDNFFTAYFNAYLNCNHSNFYDQYKFIAASVPGLTLFKASIQNFVKDYPDGKILVMIRQPLIWWNSARFHSKGLKVKGLERYKSSLENTIWACRRYPSNVFVVSFDQLVQNTKRSVEIICDHAGIKFYEVATYPSNFPSYGKDNSTFGHKNTKVVIKDKIKRQVKIPKDEEAWINSNLIPIYKNVFSNYTVNAN
jgi:hypothetical protein